MGRLTNDDPVVGRSPHLHRLRPLLVDPPPDLILQRCPYLVPPLHPVG